MSVSLWKVSAIQRNYYSGARTIVRMAHWQLEGGYREALQIVIDDYNKLMAERFQRGEIAKPVEESLNSIAGIKRITSRSREGVGEMSLEFALDADDLAADFVLTCQSHPLTPRVVVSFDER